MNMRVLLIEDEQHKANDLHDRITKSGVTPDNLILARGVRQAVLHVETDSFDLIVLDMALPTFTAGQEGPVGGYAQAVGGVEVLRALQAHNIRAKIIIVTQYPEIVVGGKQVKLQQAAKLVSQKYGQDVLGVVLYSYKSPVWAGSFDGLLRKAK